jgi:hypothetical protein
VEPALLKVYRSNGSNFDLSDPANTRLMKEYEHVRCLLDDAGYEVPSDSDLLAVVHYSFSYAGKLSHIGGKPFRSKDSELLKMIRDGFGRRGKSRPSPTSTQPGASITLTGTFVDAEYFERYQRHVVLSNPRKARALPSPFFEAYHELRDYITSVCEPPVLLDYKEMLAIMNFCLQAPERYLDGVDHPYRHMVIRILKRNHIISLKDLHDAPLLDRVPVAASGWLDEDENVHDEHIVYQWRVRYRGRSREEQFDDDGNLVFVRAKDARVIVDTNSFA